MPGRLRRREARHELPDFRRKRRLGGGDRARDPRPDRFLGQAFFRRRHGFRRRAQHPGVAGRRGDAGDVAGYQRALRRTGNQDRPWVEGEDQPAFGFRAQELLLRRLAAGLPNLPVCRAHRRRRHGDPGHARRQNPENRHRAPAHGTRRRQIPARPGPEAFVHRPQPFRHRVDGDRFQARPADARGSRNLPAQDTHDPTLPGDV